MRNLLPVTLLLLVSCAAPAARDEPAPPRATPAPAPAATAASEEAAGPMTLTVPDALAVAMERNPDLAVAAARIDAAREGVASARSALYPTLGLALSYTHTNDPVMVFMNRLRQRELSMTTDFNHPGDRGNFRASVEARWLVWDGGRRAAGEDLARLGAVLEEGARDAVLNELKAGVIATALTVFEAGEFIRVSEESVGLVTEQLRLAKSRFEAGAARRSDVLSVEVRKAEAEEALVRAKNARERAIAALRTLLGVSASREIRLGAGPGFRVPPIEEEDLYLTALGNRPEVRRAADAVRAAERSVAMNEAEYLPMLSAFGSYDLDDQSGTFTAKQDSVTAGLRLDVPVFTGFRTRARVAKARARVREAKESERKARLAVESDVTRAKLALSEAGERLAVSRKSVEQAEEALSLIRARYEAGAATITESLDAEVALTGARVRNVAARYDVERATADLRRALGICRAAPGKTGTNGGER